MDLTSFSPASTLKEKCIRQRYKYRDIRYPVLGRKTCSDQRLAKIHVLIRPGDALTSDRQPQKKTSTKRLLGSSLITVFLHVKIMESCFPVKIVMLHHCAESTLNNQIYLYAEKSVFFRVRFWDFDQCPKTYLPKTPPEFNEECKKSCLITGQQNGRSAMDVAAQITKQKNIIRNKI